MASMKFSLVLLLTCTFFFQGILADIICENLPTNVCAFSVSSSGKRCLLENSIKGDREVEYQCKTSEVVVGSSISEYLETDECVNACSVDRKSVGMSSDALLEPTFTAKICSPACYNNCPNLIDFYFNLAAGEGVYLPDLCEKQRTSLRRDMVELQSGNALTPSSPRRDMIELESDSALAPTSPHRDMVELESDSALTPTSPRRDMVELQSDSALAPVADAPTQWSYPRRAMVELLSNDAKAPGPISSDDLVADTPTPSPLYF